MPSNVEMIAAALGARIVGNTPDTGGGAFGAARLAARLHGHAMETRHNHAE